MRPDPGRLLTAPPDAPPQGPLDETRLAAIAAAEWSFDPAWITLNHGSFGACPRSVRAAEAGFRARLDRQPTRFLHHEITPLVRASAAAVAGRFGARAEDLVLVENATQGVNAVLRSVRLAPGDEIVVLDHAYGAVLRAVEHAARAAGAVVVRVETPFPDADPDRLVERLSAALGARTALAVLDHVTSASALVLPLARMVRACHARGVRVLVDAAHAPGMVEFGLGEIGADWHVGNLHKWMFAGGGSAFLHARAEVQADLRPVSISHGSGDGLAAAFDWTGTRDFSAWLALPDALRFHAALGGAALMARNAALVRAGAELVAGRIGGALHPGCLPGAAMALVGWPGADGSPAAAASLRSRLIAAAIDVPVVALSGRLWLRVSAQAYNRLEDFARLATRLAEIGAGG